MCETRERMVLVTDNWYPCFDGNKVRLKLKLCYFKGYYIKLSAWGADDTGVEIEYKALDLPDAVKQFKVLSDVFDSVPDGCNRQWFYDHGFVPA